MKQQATASELDDQRDQTLKYAAFKTMLKVFILSTAPVFN